MTHEEVAANNNVRSIWLTDRVAAAVRQEQQQHGRRLCQCRLRTHLVLLAAAACGQPAASMRAGAWACVVLLLGQQKRSPSGLNGL
jgi:hypothetical protein